MIESFDGMESLLTSEGSPPPPGDVVNVMNMATRLGCCCDEPDMYGAYLQASTDGVTKIPLTRFDIDPYYEPVAANILMNPGKSYTKHMAFVDGTDIFDHRYFEISSGEAIGMDPLQRQVLEVGGASMGLYGITKKVANRDSHHGSVSVGVDKADWMFLCSSGSCNATAIIANRFSFSFNLKGPNFVCDTACSASLVATHLGKLMLLERVWDPLEFHLAIGTHWCGSPGPFIGTSQGQMSSPGGRCFTFNATADGYLRGEGTSGILLKYGNLPKERECIWRASSSTQDGRSASLTAPNGPAQEAAVAKATREARIQSPESNAWECHGTGTALGDPIEVGAVRKGQVKVQRSSPLMLGSAKSNTGHLEGGAAMAGIVKCCLSITRARAMPTNHCHTLNPHLEAAAFTAFFSVEAMCFPSPAGHAQVSSFGFGGTNGHGILWGSDANRGADLPAQMMKRIASMKPPEVRAYGRNPDEWESDWVDRDVRPGDKVALVVTDEKPSETSIKAIKVESPEEEEVFYSITGDFNSWSSERMSEGEIHGLYTTTVEVPPSGSFEFRFLEQGDEKKVVCPQTPLCSKRIVPIMGPSSQLTNSWLISGVPGSEMQIELLVQKTRKSVMWLQT
jgi:acyl transferase domain-containing protein